MWGNMLQRKIKGATPGLGAAAIVGTIIGRVSDHFWDPQAAIIKMAQMEGQLSVIAGIQMTNAASFLHAANAWQMTAEELRREVAIFKVAVEDILRRMREIGCEV